MLYYVKSKNFFDKSTFLEIYFHPSEFSPKWMFKKLNLPIQGILLIFVKIL